MRPHCCDVSHSVLGSPWMDPSLCHLRGYLPTRASWVLAQQWVLYPLGVIFRL
jgi:hypothetical protein